jgi:hypothetical protein
VARYGQPIYKTLKEKTSLQQRWPSAIIKLAHQGNASPNRQDSSCQSMVIVTSFA